MKLSAAQSFGVHIPVAPRSPGPSQGGRFQRTISAGTGLDLAALAARRPPPQTGRLRRSASLSARPTDPATPAPPLHKLIGEKRARGLDTRFGSLQPVRTKGGDGLHKWERDEAGKPLTHERRIALPDAQGHFPDLTSASTNEQVDLDALKRGEKTYLWAVGALGRVFVGEEEPVGKDPLTGKARYRGHPLLVSGWLARVCGEMKFNASTGRFVVSDKSGRYGRYEDRIESHVKEVADLFAHAGVPVEALHLGGKTREPLILPSLDPNFRPGKDCSDR